MSQNIWFSSDLHCYHTNIIKYCNRPFDNAIQMTEQLIENHNKLVKQNDLVYWLGDIIWSFNKTQIIDLIKKFNGKKILILGNHDSKTLIKLNTSFELFTRIEQVLETTIYSQKVFMSHYPHISWPGSYHGSWMLHGHTHGNLLDDPKVLRLDVGVDTHNFEPISFEKVDEIMRNKQHQPNL